jgi:hypothetical protein
MSIGFVRRLLFIPDGSEPRKDGSFSPVSKFGADTSDAIITSNLAGFFPVHRIPYHN